MEGRSVTLYEEVHTLRTKEKPQTHLQFMQILSRMLPPDCRPIIVSDAGFRVPWFKLVASFGWDWIGRVRNRTLVHWVAEAPAEAAAWLPCKSLYPQATGTPTTLGAARLARSNPIDC